MSVSPLALALTWLAAAPATTPAPERTLWLVQPLYADQEALGTRAEELIHQVIPEESRASEVIGRKELVAALEGKAGDIKCLLGEAECRDPLDALVGSLGFSRVILLKGGRDDAGYRFKVSSYRPADGNVTTAEGTGNTLDRALFGAVAKLAPIATTMEVKSTPPGATVFIDNEKLGTAPLTTQVLPGERTLKLDLPGYKPLEITQLVPARGQVSVQRDLEKLPARVIISATPAGAEIYLDGKLAGKDKVDEGVQPGTHVIRITAPDYKPHQLSVEIKPDETYTLKKALQPTTFLGMPIAIGAAQEDIYRRKSSFEVAFETVSIKDDSIDAKHLKSNSTFRADRLISPRPGAAHLLGVSAEYSTYGRYFGLMVIGLLYAQHSKPWTIHVRTTDPTMPVPPGGDEIVSSVNVLTLRALQPQLRIALWRFTLSGQGGLEVRGMRFKQQSEAIYSDGFLLVDTQVVGQGAIRLFLFEGLFLEAAYRYSTSIVSLYEGKGPAMQTLRAGAGYAF